MKKNIGVYVHIPFCKAKCYYCDFTSFANKTEIITEYVDAVVKEIRHSNLSEYEIDTIYVGGGTPSILESDSILKIVKEIRGYEIKNVEITIEVNPGTVEEKKLKAYMDMGINRLSIGLQSTQNSLLEQIGRIHTYEQFLHTYRLARKIGFNNINIDLMLGLPNQSIEMLRDSLNEIISLEPEHISVYSLILEEHTKLYNIINQEELKLPSEEVERTMYWETKDMLEKNGYVHYEISNFSKSGYESKHNSNCWKQKEYLRLWSSGTFIFE